MRILAVGAHPDDLEILCAGTLVKCAQRGDEVSMAYLCTGDKGHFEIPARELGPLRKKEAEEAAKIVEAKICGGYFPDLELYPDREARHKVVELIRLARPEMVITHSPDDYMADHTTTSRLVIEASFTATLPHYQSEQKATKIIPPIFFMDTAAGVNFQPTEYVDITKEMPTKEKMLRCHQSQYKWIKEHDGIDLIGLMKKLSGLRGMQCGVEYAEGFRQYLVWERMTTRRLLP